MLVLKDNLNLFHTANSEFSAIMQELGKLQVYIDDWETLPEEMRQLVKSKGDIFLSTRLSLIQDIKDYIDAL